MDLNKLQTIGLKNKEAKVYIALLKQSPSLANHLAKEANILRSSIYDYLETLLEKGFISYTIKSGKKYFQAVNPKKILNNFNEQKKLEENALKEIVPQLTKLQNTADKKSKIEIFEGKEGMKSVFSYILKENPKKILIYGSSGVGYKLLPFFLEHWHKQRIKQKIAIDIIYNKTKESKERIKKGPSLRLAKIKFLQIEHSSLTGAIIYNNKVLLTVWNMDSPLAISIESEEIARSYKDNFGVLWKVAKK